jgi:hypothetical protein
VQRSEAVIWALCGTITGKKVPKISVNPKIFNEVVENNKVENFREPPPNPPHPRSHPNLPT